MVGLEAQPRGVVAACLGVEAARREMIAAFNGLLA